MISDKITACFAVSGFSGMSSILGPDEICTSERVKLLFPVFKEERL